MRAKKQMWTYSKGKFAIGSLHLQLPIGQTAALACGLALLIAIICEGLSRTLLATSPPPPTVIDTRSLLAVKMLRLEQAARDSDGSMDCLMIGNSTVWRGIDPRIVNESYGELTGRELRCFNFGLPGLTVAGEAALAEFLVERYDPWLLVYGTSPVDFLERRAGDAVAESVLRSPANLTIAKFEGWLLNNSFAYRLLFANKWSYVPEIDITDYGHSVATSIGEVTAIPSAHTYPEEFALYSDYKVRSDDMAAFERILHLSQRGTQVIVIEVPVASNYTFFLPDGEQSYDDYVHYVADAATDRNIPILEADATLSIPTDGWEDYVHLNSSGARVFSRWTGEQIGLMVNGGLVIPPSQ